MARRVPLHETSEAIEIIEQDGGVILTNFSSIADVESVNRDAAPFLSEIKQDVSPQLRHPLLFKPICIES